MKFFKQTIKGSCNVIAIQHVLSFYDVYPSYTDIQNSLPKHPFGSWITEIGTYLGQNGYKTKLISNSLKFSSPNYASTQSLMDYQKVGVFEDRLPTFEDIKDKPILINVDAFKIRGELGGPGAHYVVAVKDNDSCWMYDGSNYDQKESISFEKLYNCSLDINEFHENGMWLLLS